MQNKKAADGAAAFGKQDLKRDELNGLEQCPVGNVRSPFGDHDPDIVDVHIFPRLGTFLVGGEHHLEPPAFDCGIKRGRVFADIHAP